MVELKRAALARMQRYLQRKAERLDERLVAGALARAGVPDAGSIPTHTGAEELRALYRLATRCPPGGTVLEIGSYLGAATCYLGAGIAERGGRLYCVDTWANETMDDGDRDTFPEFERNVRGLRCELTVVRKRSEDIRREEVPAPLDLVFIDADHSYAAAKRDFATVRPWLADDAVVAFHDFSYPKFEGVTRVVGEALASGEWVLRGFVDSLAWIAPAHWIRQPAR